MKPPKKGTTVHDFLDALADVIADRVATRLGEASKQTEPQMAPKWLPGPVKPQRRRREPAPKGEDVRWTAERALRDSGFVTHGDPGYDEALKKHMEHRRAHDAEVRRRTQMRTAVRLFEKIVGVDRPEAPRARRRIASSGPR